MREVELTLTADDGLKIAGMLALPDVDGPHPAMVFLWPGRLDREGNVRNAALGLGKPFADALARRGIASYRFDRRGVGATGGDFRASGFIEHRNDAAAVLRGLASHREIDPSRVGAIGYSEGALHAAHLAAHDRAAAAVLVGCPTQRGDDFYLAWASRLTKEQAPWYVRLFFRPLGRTPREQVATLIEKLKKTKGDVARVYGFKIPARMCREFLAYDPKPDLAQIRIPVLAITGDNDFSIDHRDLDVIKTLVHGPIETSCPKDLTHTLRRDPRPATAKNYREQYAMPVDAELVEQVAAWTSERLRAK